MKSIAVVVPELLPVPPVQGGAVEHWVHEVTVRMARAGQRLTIFSRPAGSDSHVESNIEYRGIPWTRSERWFRDLKDRVTWRNPLRYVAKFQNVWSYGRRAMRELRDFDVVYLHNEPNLLLFLERRAAQKVVLHMHNDHLTSKLFRAMYRRALAKVDLILCVSDYIRQQAVAAFPEHASRFKVVLNATDPSVFKPYADAARRAVADAVAFESGTQYLLYVGRLVPIKGVHVLIDAFRVLRQRNAQVRLIITGSSFFEGASRTPYERRLMELAAPVKDAIVFTGYLPHEKLKYLYSAVDAVVVPSVWQEPFGLVVLEAMAAGKCVVASAVGGIPEIITDQRNGVLVPSDNPERLAAAMSQVLSDSTLRNRIETAARDTVLSNFTWERLVGELHVDLGVESGAMT